MQKVGESARGQLAPEKRREQRESPVPTLHVGHESGWVAHCKNLMPKFSVKTDKATVAVNEDLDILLRAAQRVNKSAAELNANLKKFVDLLNGEVALTRGMLREANFGPNVPHKDVRAFCEELEKRQDVLDVRVDGMNKKLKDVGSNLRVAQMRIGLAPTHRLWTQTVSWGLVVTAIAAAPFSLFEGLDIQVTESIRNYTLIGQWIAIGLFTAFKLKDIADAAEQSRELLREQKQIAVLSKVKPSGLPSLMPYKITGRGRLEIWNERWFDFWRRLAPSRAAAKEHAAIKLAESTHVNEREAAEASGE